ncbi:MAG: T9SS type A sorting domain-containing protein [bacterium]|nr:T9SS type A sorting domain-containing protein [bacterium]
MPAGQIISGSLVFELAAGTYNLSYDYFRGNGSKSFKVIEENIARISGFGVRDSGFDIGIVNSGITEFNGSIKLDSGFYQSKGSITIPANNTATYTFTNFIPSATGIYPTLIQILYNETSVHTQETALIFEPEFRVAEVSYTVEGTSSTGLTAGKTGTMSIELVNTGNIEEEVELEVQLADLINNRQKLRLAPLQNGLVDIAVEVDGDIQNGNYLGVLGCKWNGINGEKGTTTNITVPIAGNKIEVNHSLNRDYYEIGQTTTLTLDITNQSSLGTLSLSAHVRYKNYDERIDFLLTGSRSLIFAFKFSGVDERVFYGIYTDTNRGVFLNSILLKEKGTMTIWTDKQVYDEGATVTLTVILQEPGTVNLTMPGEPVRAILVFTGTDTVIFKLPDMMPSGTYYIKAEHEDFLNQARLIPIDVIGTDVRITRVTLNKERYTMDDILEARLTVQTNKPIQGLIKAWIIDPYGTITFSGTSSSEISNFKEIVINGSINPTYSGTYRLVYGVYPVDSTMTLSLGEKRFDVMGIVKLVLDVGTTTYYNTLGPINVKYKVYGDKTRRLLRILFDDEEKVNQEIEGLYTAGELNLYVNSPGTHTLKMNFGSFSSPLNIVVVDTQAPQTQMTKILGEQIGSFVSKGITYSFEGDDLFPLTTYVNLDLAEFATYTSPISLTETGSHTLRYYSIDSSQNKETTNVYEVFVDDIPPTSSLQLIGSSTIYQDEFYARPTTIIKLSAEDIGCGIQKLRMRFNEADWEDYTGSFTLTAGRQTISYYSLDALGNQEATRTAKFRIFEGITRLDISPMTKPVIVGGSYTFRVWCYDNGDNLGLPDEDPQWSMEGLLGTISPVGLWATFIPGEISIGKIKVEVGNIVSHREIKIYRQVGTGSRQISSQDKKVSCLISQEDEGILISILKINGTIITPHLLPEGMFGIKDMWYEFKALTGTGSIVNNFNQPVRIEFRYEDGNNDGIIDNTDIIAKRLKIFRFSQDKGYEEMKTEIDELNKIVSCWVNSFSTYGLAGQKLSNRIYAYPNPFIKSIHRDIRFRDIPLGGIIKIYTIAGEKVVELREDNGDYEVIFDARDLASGIYIYVVTTPQGHKEIGKIGVIR